MGMGDTLPKKERLKNRRLWAVFAVGAALIIVPAGLWLGRISLAETAVRNFCAGKGVSCSLTISKLGLNHIQATDIQLTKTNVDPVSLDELTIDLTWPKLFAPSLTSVTAVKPTLVVDARNGQVSVDILESFQSEAGSEGAQMELPPFTIKNGELTILTDAGPVKGVVNTAGSIGREVQSSLKLEPADLSLNGHSLSLQEGQASFVLAQSRISGDASLKLASAQLEGFAGQDIDLTLKIEPGDDQKYSLDWNVRVDRVESDTLGLDTLASKGSLGLQIDTNYSLETVQLLSVEGAVTANRVKFEENAVSDLTAIWDIDRSGGELTGPVSFKSGETLLDGVLTSKASLITGDVTLQQAGMSLPNGRFDGVVSVEQGRLGPSLQAAVINPLSLPEPFETHSAQLQSSLRRVVSNFNLGTEISGTYDPKSGAFSFGSERPLVMRTVDRKTVLSVQPSKTDQWLTFDAAGLRVHGNLEYADTASDLAISGTHLDFQYNIQTKAMSLKGDALVLPEWTRAGRVLDVDLRQIRFKSGEGRGTFSTKGQFRYSGPAFGTELDHATLVGAFDGLESRDGWMIRLSDEDCFDFGFSSATIADMTIGTMSTAFCAPDGVLFNRKLDARGKTLSIGGTLTSDTLKLPVTHAAMTASTTIETPVIRWTSGDASQIVFSSGAVKNAFRLTGEDKDGPHRLTIRKSTSTLDIVDNQTKVALDFRDMALNMNGLPAGAHASEWKATGFLGDDGPDFTWNILGVQITDQVNPENNALFQPLVTSGSGTLTAKEITYAGRLRLVDQDANFGMLKVSHDIPANEGHAELSGGEIVFARGSLQPYDISERLRGIAVSSTGSITPYLNASWKDGEPEADAKITLDKLSFSSFRLGDFYELSGALEISDLINLRTPPGQEFTLRGLRLSPALVLENGEFSVQLVNGNLIHLEKVSWPFVEGTLSVDPGWWALDETKQKLTVRADKWSLSRLATLFDVPDLDVQGTVSGEFPIEIIGPNLYLRDARLDSVENGRIRYLGDIGSQAGSANEYAKMAFDALRDFDYRVLSIGANGNLQDDIMLEMSISGRNKDVLEGHTFNLNISLQSKLAELIHGSSFVTSTTATKDAVLNLIRDKQAASED